MAFSDCWKERRWGARNPDTSTETFALLDRGMEMYVRNTMARTPSIPVVALFLLARGWLSGHASCGCGKSFCAAGVFAPSVN
jgi:hypothetical protein